MTDVLSDRESWTAAIVADPDDNTVRLAFADWLDEHGDGWDDEARAEHIRHHILGTPVVLLLDPSPSLQWVEPLPRHSRREQAAAVEYLDGDGTAATLRFARGFAAAVECALNWWLAHGPAVVRAHPVTTVRLAGKAPTGVEGVGFMWLYDNPSRPNDPASLPRELMVPPVVSREGGFPCRFETADDALAGLSAAALAWAKSAPLPSHPA